MEPSFSCPAFTSNCFSRHLTQYTWAPLPLGHSYRGPGLAAQRRIFVRGVGCDGVTDGTHGNMGGRGDGDQVHAQMKNAMPPS